MTISTIAADARARSRSPVDVRFNAVQLVARAGRARTRSALSPSRRASRTRRTSAAPPRSRSPRGRSPRSPSRPTGGSSGRRIASQIPRAIVPRRPTTIATVPTIATRLRLSVASGGVDRAQRDDDDPGHDNAADERGRRQQMKRRRSSPGSSLSQCWFRYHEDEPWGCFEAFHRPNRLLVFGSAEICIGLPRFVHLYMSVDRRADLTPRPFARFPGQAARLDSSGDFAIVTRRRLAQTGTSRTGTSLRSRTARTTVARPAVMVCYEAMTIRSAPVSVAVVCTSSAGTPTRVSSRIRSGWWQ